MSSNAVLTIVLLVLLLLLTTAPFSILSVLMAVALLSATLWTGWTLIQAALTGNPPKDTP
jgi:hypothetical protein